MTLQLPTVGTTDTGRAINADDLFELLAAFQFLQGGNARMASALSGRLGLGSADLKVLLFLSRTPDATPKQIARQLDQTSGSVTALLDRLERSGHLRRNAHPTDRRSIILRITDEGDAVVREVRGAYREAFVGVFTVGELDHATQVLRALGSALGPAAERVNAE